MPIQLTTIQDNKAQFAPVLIRDGVKGNYQVVLEMIRITNESVKKDLGLQKLAADLLLFNNLDSTSDTRRIFETLFNFVARKNSVIMAYAGNTPVYNNTAWNTTRYISYIQDIAGATESIKDARRTLADKFGDCDDHAILTASLLGCLGFEDVKFAVARYDNNDTAFSHVYTVVYDKGKRIVFDTTLENPKLNSEVSYVEKKEFSVFGDNESLKGLSGFIFSAKRQAKKLGRVMIESIPTATAFLPLGFVSGNALAISAQLVNQSATKELSFPAVASKINDKLDEIIVELMRSSMAYDLARSYALQISAQVNAVTDIQLTNLNLNKIKSSIKEKLDFIKHFPEYAKQNNIKLVYLDSNKILLGFAAMASFSGFLLYKAYKGTK